MENETIITPEISGELFFFVKKQLDRKRGYFYCVPTAKVDNVRPVGKVTAD
jgi:hypothetical protein